MSRNESRMSDGSRARSTPWAMAVLLLGLVGCASTQHSAPPAKHPDTVGTTKEDLANSPPQCKSRQGPIPGQPTLELDAAWLKGPDDIGCVDPGGKVRFASKCPSGPSVYMVSTKEKFFTPLTDGRCGKPSQPNQGWVVTSNNTYVITLGGKDDYCEIAITGTAGTSVDYWHFSACNASHTSAEGFIPDVTPIKGTLEVATSGPGEDDKANAGQR